MPSEIEVDVVVIGGGPAGMAAAVAASKEGAHTVIIERERRLGGILNQCIHAGFGLKLYSEDLTGPEYAARLVEDVQAEGVKTFLNSMVLDLNERRELIVATDGGIVKIKASSVVLAMGCRERTRGMVGIVGTRPAGVYTAGVAQNFINVRNLMVGKKIVVLGSGDIGLIMARRLTLEGAKVVCVAEKMPYCCGLRRNVVQCLDDFGIPLLLGHTVTEIRGGRRVEGVVLSRVDERFNPVAGSEREVECDTLLLSVGLIPENELSRKAGVALDELTGGPVVNELFETSVSGVFACGNVLHVHDVADRASLEAYEAGRNAARWAKDQAQDADRIPVYCGESVQYVLPQRIDASKDSTLMFRAIRPGKKTSIIVLDGKRLIKEKCLDYVNPAEMETFHVSRKELEGAKSIELSIEYG